VKLIHVFVGALIVSISGVVLAQAVDIRPKQESKTSKAPNEARNISGVIDEDAQIEGITVINGEVTIDGVKIPRGTKKYRSAKSGKTYVIEWGKDNNVSIAGQ